MPDGNGVFWMLGALASAFLCALFAWAAWNTRRAREGVLRAARARATDEGAPGVEGRFGPRTFDDRLIGHAEAASRKVALGLREPLRWGRRSAHACLAAHGLQAGVEETVSVEGLAAARLDVAFGAAAFGVVSGAVFSLELAALLGMAGALFGWRAVPRAIAQRKKARVEELERHLPEMLETLAMGLRSGLSFDRSLALYCGHFDTLLARSCDRARNRWLSGLASREEALRALAASYDSASFSRVVETTIRSLRFGSALAETLEEAAAQARAAYRADRQERVAKAPVKMMVPTGALMLPAMLLLILGPVLLELMEGF